MPYGTAPPPSGSNPINSPNKTNAPMVTTRLTAQALAQLDAVRCSCCTAVDNAGRILRRSRSTTAVAGSVKSNVPPPSPISTMSITSSSGKDHPDPIARPSAPAPPDTPTRERRHRDDDYRSPPPAPPPTRVAYESTRTHTSKAAHQPAAKPKPPKDTYTVVFTDGQRVRVARPDPPPAGYAYTPVPNMAHDTTRTGGDGRKSSHSYPATNLPSSRETYRPSRYAAPPDRALSPGKTMPKATIQTVTATAATPTHSSRPAANNTPWPSNKAPPPTSQRQTSRSTPITVPPRKRDTLHPDDAYAAARDSLDFQRGQYVRAREERAERAASRLRHSSSSSRSSESHKQRTPPPPPPILKTKKSVRWADRVSGGES